MAITAKDEIKKNAGIGTENVKIPAGYKLTELGLIPEDWQVKPFGQMAEITMGQSPIGISYNRKSIGVPLINGPTEFTKKHPIKIQWTTQPTKLCKNGDILLCVRGSSTGRMNISDDLYCIGRGIASIRAKLEVDLSFISFQLNSAIQTILTLTTGSTFPNIDGKTIRSIEFLLPSIKEQQAIAAALKDIDSLITNLDQLIAKKRNIKQATMQRLLTGKQRLAGFSGEWSFKTLGHCLMETPAYGINAPAVPYQDNLPRYIRITDITEDGYFSTEKLSSVKTINSEKYLLTDGDLVFARTGASVGKSYLYNSKDGHLVFAGFLIKVKPNPKYLLSNFLASYAKTHQYKNWVRLISMRSGQPGINGNEYAQMPLQLPGLSEQCAIANILSDMDIEISTLEQQLDKTRSLKQGMMQELLTGRIRLI